MMWNRDELFVPIARAKMTYKQLSLESGCKNVSILPAAIIIRFDNSAMWFVRKTVGDKGHVVDFELRVVQAKAHRVHRECICGLLPIESFFSGCRDDFSA